MVWMGVRGPKIKPGKRSPVCVWVDDDEVLLNERRSGSAVKPHLLFGTTGCSGFLKLVVLFFSCFLFTVNTFSQILALYSYKCMTLCRKGHPKWCRNINKTWVHERYLSVKGAFYCFGDEIQTQNLNNYNINEVIRQYLFFPELNKQEENKVEARKVAGSAKYKQAKK